MEPIIFVAVLAAAIYLAFKVVKVVFRLAILVCLVLAVYFLLYPRIVEYLS